MIFYSKDRVIATKPSYMSIPINEEGTVMFSKRAYDMAVGCRELYGDIELFIEDLPDVKKENVLLYAENMGYPEKCILYYAVLIDDKIDLSFGELINHLNMMLSDTAILKNELMKLYEADIFYKLKDLANYEFALKEFIKTCINYDDLISPRNIEDTRFIFLKATESGHTLQNNMQYAQPSNDKNAKPSYFDKLTDIDDSDGEEWKRALESGGKYMGYGEIYLPNEGFLYFEDDAIKAIEEYLGIKGEEIEESSTEEEVVAPVVEPEVKNDVILPKYMDELLRGEAD